VRAARPIKQKKFALWKFLAIGLTEHIESAPDGGHRITKENRKEVKCKFAFTKTFQMPVSSLLCLNDTTDVG
jgi:hypothetical protein